jgi:hypothetical protein
MEEDEEEEEEEEGAEEHAARGHGELLLLFRLDLLAAMNAIKRL